MVFFTFFCVFFTFLWCHSTTPVFFLSRSFYFFNLFFYWTLIMLFEYYYINGFRNSHALTRIRSICHIGISMSFTSHNNVHFSQMYKHGNTFEFFSMGAILFFRLCWVSYNIDLSTLERWNCARTNKFGIILYKFALKYIGFLGFLVYFQLLCLI